MTKFKDVAHLYIGCKMQSGHILIGIQPKNEINRPMLMAEDEDNPTSIAWEADWNMDKPVLRPLSSMTEEDEMQICEIVGVFLGGYLIEALKNGTKYMVDIQCSFDLTRYLLSKSFDLFGLIDSGEAIDATKEGI